MSPWLIPVAGLFAAATPGGDGPSGAPPAIWLTSRPATFAAPAGPIELRRADDGLFYVEGVVNGAPVRFLVDTGASMIVLTAADARRVGAAAAGEVLKVDTAQGQGAMARVNLRSVRVGGKVSASVPAVVAEEGLAVSLLGQNWLSQLAAVIIQGDRMEMR